MGKFNFKEEDFEKAKIKAEEFYDTIKEVHCPYFAEKIAFNAKGIKHLKFKTDQQARPRNDQYVRLKLVYFAPEVLKLSKTVQGISEKKKLEHRNINSRWEYVMKLVRHYEFIAVLNGVRVKVIVKEVEGGEKHFWSVIPFWGIDKETSRRVLYSGDPESD